VFVPDEDSLTDLYLADRALKNQKLSISYTRWQAQGMPLLALLLAIYKTLLKKGFRQLYRDVAKKTRARLRAGLIKLPPVLEV
jgi:heme exporter protein D